MTGTQIDRLAVAFELAEEYATQGLHPVHLARLRRLARILGVTVDDLMAAAVDA